MLQFVTNEDVRILRDIEQFFATQIDEMPVNIGEVRFSCDENHCPPSLTSKMYRLYNRGKAVEWFLLEDGRDLPEKSYKKH